MRVYRVLYHDAQAAPTEQGGLLYIPAQGQGRVDNPASYAVLYVGDSPAGVCAEVFNTGKYRRQWSADMLRPMVGFPKASHALAWYDLDDSVQLCDLDDPQQLVAQTLRPSTVITRDIQTTQAWALRLFNEQRWAAVKWWSYHDARWGSIGLWNIGVIRSYGVEELTMAHPAIAQAATVLSIKVIRPRLRRTP